MIKKILMLTAMMVLLVAKATAQEIYAVLSSDKKTLTFYYDNQKNSRSGKVYNYEYNVEGWSNQIFPEWYACRETVTKAVFDQSMSSARPDNCRHWFVQFSKLKEIENIEYLDTRNATDMSYMFYNCQALTSLDLSSFDTHNVTTMYRMFFWCNSLTSLNVSNFDTQNVTTMKGMFTRCESLTSLNLHNFDTHNVTNMYEMFNCCSSLSYVNLSSFDTQNVDNMISMFENCESLTYLNLSNFSILKGGSFERMFEGCKSLFAVDLTNFSLGNGENWTYTTEMFRGCSQLSTIYCDNDWCKNKSSIRDESSMFYGCDMLIGSCGTRYSDNGGGIKYAHPDEPGNPGYFTQSTKRVGIYVNGEPMTGNLPSKYVSNTGNGEYYARYVVDENTLYLANAKVNIDGEGIFALSSLVINLTGNNSITTTGDAITLLDDDCSIEGSGQLDIRSTKGYGISHGGMLETTGTGSINISGKLGALYGRPYTDNAGETRYGYLVPYQLMTLSSDGQHPVVNDLGTIERGDWVMNYAYSYASYYRTVVDKYSKKSVTKPFTIVPKDKIKYYPITLGGNQLNNHNADNFDPMSLTSGSVTYNNTTHTLTLDNAKFGDYEANEDYGLEVNLQDFNLELKGNNSIVGKDKESFYGIFFGEKDLYNVYMRNWRIKGVTGTGEQRDTLRYKGPMYFESIERMAYVTFTNMDLVCEDDCCLWSQDYVDMTIDDCNFDLWDKTPSDFGIMESLHSLTLKDCHFENGCYWDNEWNGVLNRSGKPESRHISIKRGEATSIYGDVNGDGSVDVADIASVISVMAGSADYEAADVNGDGSIDVADIATIISIMAGK